MKNPAAVSARAALLALSLVAAFSLARCFVGPGDIVPAAAAAVVGDLTIFAATAAARRSRFAGIGLAVLGPVAVLMVPIWIVAGGATTWGWPTFATWHAVGVDLQNAWTVFNALRSPVPELAGLVLVGAWAVGGAAVLAGWAADGGDTPLWVVAPPTAIFLFTSALGTPGWRAVSISAEVAALGWYAVSARAARRAHAVGHAERAPAAGAAARRTSFGVAWPAATIVAVAALFAGVVGPHLPGASSPALVSLRNSSDGPSSATGQVLTAPAGQISINTMVQVAETEIYQSKAIFFDITTPSPTYTVLTTLDTFDGNTWTSSESGTPLDATLPYDQTSMTVPERTDGGKEALFETRINVNQLGGQDVPAPAVPVAGSGDGTLVYDSPYATLISQLGLSGRSSFEIVSEVPLEPPSTAPASLASLPADVQGDTALPVDVPASIVALAHQIVDSAHATTDYEKAMALQAFFQSGEFKYDLPQSIPGTTHAVSGGEGLHDLATFLFQTRTGFCQQYASAYAVLARIDGLASRVAVGFTTGTAMNLTSYQVTGADVHAWPQVYLGGDFGWWSFEPTPGDLLPSPPLPTLGGSGGGSTSTGKGGSTSRQRVRGASQQRPAPGGGGAAPAANPGQPKPLPGPNAGIVWLVVLGLLVLLFGAAPVTRLARRQRTGGAAARVVNAWSEAAASLALVGLYQHDGETYGELACRVARTGALPPAACEELADLARSTTVAAFAPSAPSAELVHRALAASRAVSAAARRSVSVWRRAWAAVDPRGVLELRTS